LLAPTDYGVWGSVVCKLFTGIYGKPYYPSSQTVLNLHCASRCTSEQQNIFLVNENKIINKNVKLAFKVEAYFSEYSTMNVPKDHK